MARLSRRRFIQLTGATGAAAVIADQATPTSATAGMAERGESGTALVEFRQGTNVSAAVSPAGDRLIVEIQGVLWGLDAGGGPATQLTPWDLEPARPDWSRTGVAVTFEAYKGGNFHVWTMSPDGSQLRQWTDGPWDDREPAWSPDGTRIAFSSERAVGESIERGSYDIWVLHVGTGELTRLTSDNSEDYEPSWSPDGRRILFVRNRTTVMSIDAAGGPATLVATVDTGLIERPALSPAGVLAYVHLRGLEPGSLTPVGSRSLLVVGGRDVTSDEDVFAVPLRWLGPDELLYCADGAVRVRNLARGAVRDIPFEAQLRVQRDRYRKKNFRFTAEASEPVRGVAFPRLSPDGRQVAFIALNAVWLMPLGGRLRKLVDSAPQFLIQSLNWSRDGRYLLYSVDRDGYPAVYQREVSSGTERRLTELPGAQVHPALSPDGRTLAVNNEAQALLTVDVATGAVTHLADPLVGPELLGPPSWSPDGQFLAFNDRQQINGRFREGYNVIRVIEVATGVSRIYPPAPHRSISDRGDCGPAWSPDGQWMAFIMESALWVIPVAPNGTPTGPARRLTDEPADSPSWSDDSQTLLYLSNGRLRLIERTGLNRRTVETGLTWRRSVRPRARRTRIHAGRLWDGTGEYVHEDVDLIIEGARIRAVTAHHGPGQPGEQYVEAGDKTVIPGLWECHNHPFEQPAFGGRYMSLYLAYGITSNVSMGGLAYPSTKERESLAAGARLGPRFFSTGELIEGSRVSHPPVRAHATHDGVLRTLIRAHALEWDYVKTYVRAPGTVMAEAARFGHFVLGVPSGSHLISPGYEAGQDMTAHLQATERLPYGHAVSATSLPYQDVYEIYTDGGFILMITPFRAQVLFGTDPTLAADPRVQQLMPPWARAVVVARSQHPPTAAELDALRKEARIYATVLHRGGTVITGTDSPLVPPAVSMHVALRALRLYGMTAAEALRTATALPAHVWGVDNDLGTLQPGRIADLAFVAGNPFADFNDLVNITHVMKGGALTSTAQIIASYPSAPADGRPADEQWLATGVALLHAGNCCAPALPAIR
jgi:Tol biopolymer transport system component